MKDANEAFATTLEDISDLEGRLDNLTQIFRAHEHAAEAHFGLLQLQQNVLFGIRKAIHDLQITPQLIDSDRLLNLVRNSLGQGSHGHAFAVDPDSIYTFAQILVTHLDLDKFTMEATYCLPLITKSNTYLLLKPVARGHFSKSGEAFLKPQLPSFALQSFAVLDHLKSGRMKPSNARMAYANLEHCRRNVGSVHICSIQVPLSSPAFTQLHFSRFSRP